VRGISDEPVACQQNPVPFSRVVWTNLGKKWRRAVPQQYGVDGHTARHLRMTDAKRWVGPSRASTKTSGGIGPQVFLAFLDGFPKPRRICVHHWTCPCVSALDWRRRLRSVSPRGGSPGLGRLCVPLTVLVFLQQTCCPLKALARLSARFSVFPGFYVSGSEIQARQVSASTIATAKEQCPVHYYYINTTR